MPGSNFVVCRCARGHITFRVHVHPDQVGETAEVAELVCNTCNEVYKIIPGTGRIDRTGKVSKENLGVSIDVPKGNLKITPLP